MKIPALLALLLLVVLPRQGIGQKVSNDIQLLLDSAEYYIEVDISRSRQLLNKINGMALEYQDSLLLVRTLVLSGRLYHFNGKSEIARKEVFEAVKIARLLKGPTLLAYAYDNLGLIYRNRKSYKKADHFFNQSVEIYRLNSDTLKWANVINNKACSFRDQSKHELALLYNDSALRLLVHFHNDYIFYESIYIRSTIYASAKNYDSAYYYLKRFFSLERLLENPTPSANYASMASYCLKLGKYGEAEAYLDSAVQLFHSDRKLHTLRMYYDAFSFYYREQGDFKKALYYQTKAYYVLDSIFLLEQEGAVSKAESAFDLYRKEKEVEVLEAAQQLSRLKLRELMIALFCSVIIVALLIFMFVNKQKVYKKEAYRKQQLLQKNRQLMEVIDKRDELLAMVSHNLKTPLVGIQYILKSLMGSPHILTNVGCKEKVQVIHLNVDKMIDSTHYMLEGFQNSTTGTPGTMVELNKLIGGIVDVHNEHAKSKRVSIDFKNKQGSEKLEIDEFILHQILDNVLSNAIKYSSTKTTVSIRSKIRFSSFLFVELINRNKDLSTERRKVQAKDHNTDSSGLGLYLVKRYVQILKGKMWYDFNKNGYTRFSLVVPLAKPL